MLLPVVDADVDTAFATVVDLHGAMVTCANLGRKQIRQHDKLRLLQTFTLRAEIRTNPNLKLSPIRWPDLFVNIARFREGLGHR